MKNDIFKKFLQSFQMLNVDEIDELIESSTTTQLGKSEFFIQEGETCKSVTFVLSGILRSYYTTDNGDDITYCITFPNNFMTAYSSFLTGQATQENIQAITPTELITISKDAIEQLTARSQNWVLFQKSIAEQQYIELEKRIFLLQGSNATKRYLDLMQNHPNYIQHIPLHYLASYLGVTQRHLSRIRKEISF